MTIYTEVIDLTKLYEQDYHLWLETNINLLKNRNLTEIDLENLIEELESMGRKDKNAVWSNLTILLMHLLKWKYQTDKRSNSWKFTIREHRNRLSRDFVDSPSLKRYFYQIFAESYQYSRKLAADETGLSLTIFPLECPFTEAEVLDEEFLPK
jgi:Domain of unknown function DUF29